MSAEGAVVKAGGPTVKNVSGFDLCRLLVGSLGTLGLIAEVVLRTRPLPAAERWVSGVADPFRPGLPSEPPGLRAVGRHHHLGAAGRPSRRRRRSGAGHRADRRARGPPDLPPHRWSLRPRDLRALAGEDGPDGSSASSASASPTPPHPSRRDRSTPRWGRSTSGSSTCSTPRAGSPRAATRWSRRRPQGHGDGPRHRRRRPGELRRLRAVPAALPHLPRDRRGGALATGPGGGDAPGAVGGSGRRRLVRPLDGDLRAVPGVRDGLPVGRALRAPDRADACHPGRRAPRAGPWGRGSGARRRPPLALRAGLRALGHHRLVLAGSTALALAQRVRLVPSRLVRRFGLPTRLPLRRPRLRPSGTDVWLFTGCVMDAWMRDVHADVQRVVEATGAGVALPGTRRRVLRRAGPPRRPGVRGAGPGQRTMAAFPGDAPILVDAAGCGAALRDYGHLLGTEEARAFSARVLDVHEWLADHVDALPRRGGALRRPDRAQPDRAPGGGRAGSVPPPPRAAMPTWPCGRCCRRSPPSSSSTTRGCAAGPAAPTPRSSPTWRGRSASRKVAAIERSGAPVVASANPGCALHLAAAGADRRPPVHDRRPRPRTPPSAPGARR